MESPGEKRPRWGRDLPEQLLRLCLLQSLTLEDSEVMESAAATMDRQVRRMGELASVCKEWRDALCSDSCDTWRAFAQDFLNAPASIPTDAWRGLLALRPGQRATFRGVPGFKVVRVADAAAGRYALRGREGGEFEASPPEVQPPNPWRHLCVALGLLSSAAGGGRAGGGDGTPASARTGASGGPPLALMGSCEPVLPRDAFSMGAQYQHLFPQWQARDRSRTGLHPRSCCCSQRTDDKQPRTPHTHLTARPDPRGNSQVQLDAQLAILRESLVAAAAAGNADVVLYHIKMNAEARVHARTMLFAAPPAPLLQLGAQL